MPVCESCEEKITYLIYSYTDSGHKKMDKLGKTTNWYIPEKELYKIRDGKVSAFGWDDMGESERCSGFKCPKCNTELFEGEEEATLWLQGKKKRKT